MEIGKYYKHKVYKNWIRIDIIDQTAKEIYYRGIGFYENDNGTIGICHSAAFISKDYDEITKEKQQ